MATYGYARVSTEEQAGPDKSSLDLQTTRVEAMAVGIGWKIDRMFREDVSGAVPFRKRTAGGDLLALVQPGDRILCAKLDRAFRSMIDALATSDELAHRGVDLILLDMGTEPVNKSIAGTFFFRILAAVADLERSTIKERQRNGQRAKRARGGYIGGKVEFGHMVEGHGHAARLVTVPEHLQAIDTMRALRAEGKSLRAIRDAVAAQHGVKVTHQTVNAVLARQAA